MADPDLSAEARAFLDGNVLPAELAAAGALAEELARIAGGADRALAKRARRGLHLLRTRGVRAEIPLAAAPARAVPAAEPEASSLVSVILRDGEQLVWYARPHHDGGYAIYQAQMTETEGLTRFETGHLARRRWREMEQELAAELGLYMVRVPASFARWLMEEAYQRSVDLGRTPLRSYAEVRHLLEKAVPPPENAALAGAPLPAGETARVLDLPEADRWIPDETTARKLWLELEGLSLSQLVIDERQRVEQARAAIARACDEALAGPWRARLEQRLRDTATLIVTALPRPDETRDRIADAALCLAASRNVEPLARALFDRLGPARELSDAEEPPEQKGGSLIITP